MNRIGIYNESHDDIEELKDLEELLEFALGYQKLKNVDFNVIIVDEDKILELNRDFRGIDRVTDVISFALEDYDDIKYEDYRLLGDIYICSKKIFSQASEYGHSVKRELSFLAIHGLLHLLGYDHMNPDDEKVMFDLQEEILDTFGIKR